MLVKFFILIVAYHFFSNFQYIFLLFIYLIYFMFVAQIILIKINYLPFIKPNKYTSMTLILNPYFMNSQKLIKIFLFHLRFFHFLIIKSHILSQNNQFYNCLYTLYFQIILNISS